jgi:hypothetical protein
VAVIVLRLRAVPAFLRAHPVVAKGLQLALVLATVGFCAWAVRSEWSKAAPLLEHASPVYIALALAAVAVYYLVFVLGWIRILAAWEIDVSYRVALGAEMVSMLAKYIPGGIWTPAARTVALRRSAGVTETPKVLASIFVEAALSAVSGVIVLVVSLAWVKTVNVPLLPLVAFGFLCAVGLHPRIFRPVANKLLHPFGAEEIDPLPFPEMIALLIFYCGTWLISGVSAVGAIVAVLTVFSPSGLGAREASMYALLLAVTTAGPALSVTVLNRLAITIVELLLFGIGVATWRVTRRWSQTHAPG